MNELLTEAQEAFLAQGLFAPEGVKPQDPETVALHQALQELEEWQQAALERNREKKVKGAATVPAPSDRPSAEEVWASLGGKRSRAW